MKKIIYVAHPVSGDPFENAQNAIRWVRWFAMADDTKIYVAPWVAEVQGFVGDDVSPEFYQRVLDDDIAVVQRLDGVVGVGGKWSGGMLQERAAALVTYKRVLDMTKYRSPEDVPDDFSLTQAWRGAINPDVEDE